MKNIKFMLLLIIILVASADMENTTLFMIKSVICLSILLAITVKKVNEWEKK